MVTEENERIVAVARLAEKEDTDDRGDEEDILTETEGLENEE
jgi:hypothetical protein